MATRDLTNNITASQSLAPASRTASANGTGVDTRDADSVMVLFDLGSYTGGEFTFDVEESDDDTTYTSVDSSELDGTPPTLGGSGDLGITQVGYKGDARYVRAVCATGSPTGNAVFGASIVTGHLHAK